MYRLRTGNERIWITGAETSRWCVANLLLGTPEMGKVKERDVEGDCRGKTTRTASDEAEMSVVLVSWRKTGQASG